MAQRRKAAAEKHFSFRHKKLAANPRLLYDNFIEPDDSYPAHFQKPPQTSIHPAIRLRIFSQSYNNKFGEPNHPADAMKKAKEKREVLIRVASESLSAQLAGANSDATRFSVHREGNFRVGLSAEEAGSTFDGPQTTR